jgi:cytochrome c-type biogenesis protein CcmH/NrfG
MQVAATSGVVGLTCFAAIAVVAVAQALRNGLRPGALAGAATLAAFLGTGLTTVNEFGTEWIFWASTGIIAAATASQAITADSPQGRLREKKQRVAERESNFRVFAPIAIVIAAALVALGGWTAFDASRAARSSQDARQQGQSLQAIDLGLRATRSDPRRANYWDTLGLAYIGASRWQEASNAFDQARRLAPYDVRFTSDLVQAQLLLGNAGDAGAGTRALEFADEGVGIDPNNPRPHLTRAIAMLATGNLAEALRSVERALALDPGSTNGQLYVVAVQVMSRSGRAADAIQVARQGLVVLGRSRSSVPIRIELARALVADGKPVDALAELDVALLIQPNEPTAVRLRTEIQASIPR